MGKEVKTNAVRILDRNKIEYELNKYECDDFKDGVSIADMLEQSYDMSFKTLVTVGKSGKYYVFAIPVDKEINMKKAAKEVGEKNIEMVHVKDINAVTGYIRGGCTPIGMKKNYPTVINESAKEHEKIIVSFSFSDTIVFNALFTRTLHIIFLYSALARILLPKRIFCAT